MIAQNLQEPKSAADTARWETAWSEVTARVGSQFSRRDTRAHAVAYLKGLLSPVDRKNTWQLAEALGEPTPYNLQYLLGRARWDAEAARDDLQAYVREQLGADDGVLIVDETGIVKKGNHSVGVQRQYSGTAGRVENCQIGVFLAYATSQGRTLIDRALYVPESWLADKERCREVGVPSALEFATKPQLAMAMLERALKAGLPTAWILGDEVYGNDGRLRRWCEQQRKPYVLAVSCQHRIWLGWQQVRVDKILAEAPAGIWRRRSAGFGAKGPRLYDWAFLRLPLPEVPRGWCRGILFRRSISKPDEIAYYAVFARQGTKPSQIVRAAGRRWCIEESFESTKGEVGLDQYEARSWTGWCRLSRSLTARFLSFVTARARRFPTLLGPVRDSWIVSTCEGSYRCTGSAEMRQRLCQKATHVGGAEPAWQG